jgi:hypothetical protein
MTAGSSGFKKYLPSRADLVVFDPEDVGAAIFVNAHNFGHICLLKNGNIIRRLA